jgi:hypothetical protein
MMHHPPPFNELAPIVMVIVPTGLSARTGGVSSSSSSSSSSTEDEEVSSLSSTGESASDISHGDTDDWSVVDCVDEPFMHGIRDYASMLGDAENLNISAGEKKVVSSLLHQIEQMKAKLFIHTANMNLIEEINVGKFNTVIGDVVVYCHCYCCTNFLP